MSEQQPLRRKMNFEHATTTFPSSSDDDAAAEAETATTCLSLSLRFKGIQQRHQQLYRINRLLLMLLLHGHVCDKLAERE